ncbi:MAG: GTP 3',8-cyclase MoaA, partial [Dehalococcoidia bacterium]
VGNRNGWRWDQVVPAAEIIQRIDAEMPLEPLDPNYGGEVAMRYGYRDGSGEVGVIASVSQPFCGDCTRARLSTDGSIYTCLFASKGVSLRDPLREGASDYELEELITRIWGRRVDRYSEERAELAALQNGQRKIEMYQIGG